MRIVLILRVFASKTFTPILQNLSINDWVWSCKCQNSCSKWWFTILAIKRFINDDVSKKILSKIQTKCFEIWKCWVWNLRKPYFEFAKIIKFHLCIWRFVLIDAISNHVYDQYSCLLSENAKKTCFKFW